MPSRPRILLVNPSLNPPGGQNGVAVAMIEALKDDHEVTLLAWEAIDLDAVNRYYGSRLRASDFHVRAPWRISPWLHLRIGFDASLLQRSLMLRETRRIMGGFDLTISVNGEVDTPIRAIQYVHFPFDFAPPPPAALTGVQRLPGVLAMYRAVSRRLAPVSADRIARNVTLVNSDWTGREFRRRYGGETTTVSPPVRAVAPARPWAERDDTFVVLGVLTPHKRIDTAVAILERVRAAGHPVKLHIIGSVRPADRAASAEVKRVRALVDVRRDWVRLDLDLSRDEVIAVLATSRYGLHAMLREPFGMAVAEMAAAGCIVFVHDDGGQTEIMGDESRLRYGSEEDAAAKMVGVLRDAGVQGQLRERLLRRAGEFLIERFRQRVRDIVRGNL